MAGTVIENLSTKKLVLIVAGLVVVEIIFILIGAIVSPRPTHPIGPSPMTNCHGSGSAVSKNPWELPSPCKKVDFKDDNAIGISPNDIVFAQTIPAIQSHEMIRWFQYMLSFVILRIEFQENHQVDPDAILTMDLRLAYTDSDSPDDWKFNSDAWKLLANSTEERELSCVFNKSETEEDPNGFEYDCEPIYILQLGSIPHRRYLLNIRFPVVVTDQTALNKGIGKVVQVEVVTISQTGGFTKVWLSMKTTLFTVMLFPVVWFWRRVAALSRASMLIEKAIFALGLSMLFLNLPLELFTIVSDAPWMLLFTDIRQGFFYAVLFSFWVIFTGEHLMDQVHRNKLSRYKWHLGCIFTTSFALLSFDLAERGLQLINPFGTVWKHPNIGYALLSVGAVSGFLYLILLFYLVYKVFRSISYKRRFILPAERAAHFEAIVRRLKNLMLLTVATASLTVVFFFLEQQLDGVLNEWFDHSVEVASAFFTGVYALWNIYVFIILSMYAPSHKLYELDTDDQSDEHELAALHQNTDQTAILQLTQQKERED